MEYLTNGCSALTKISSPQICSHSPSVLEKVYLHRVRVLGQLNEAISPISNARLISLVGQERCAKGGYFISFSWWGVCQIQSRELSMKDKRFDLVLRPLFPLWQMGSLADFKIIHCSMPVQYVIFVKSNWQVLPNEPLLQYLSHYNQYASSGKYSNLPKTLLVFQTLVHICRWRALKVATTPST